MDDRRFDNLIRAMATGVSRRAGVRLLAAMGAGILAMRGRDAAARPGSVPLGGDCSNDRQCDQTFVDPPFRAVCSDNGSWGPHCCVGDDNRCWAHDECCGDRLCIDGYCVDYGVYINGLGDLTDDILPGNAGGAGSLGLGEPCGDPEQCYSGSGLDATCADNGVDYGGTCCTFYGFGCASDRHCCGSLVCLGGVCTVPYEG